MKELYLNEEDRKISLIEHTKKFNHWEPATISKEIPMLRNKIAEAHRRLSRLNNLNPEVNHARKILEQALLFKF